MSMRRRPKEKRSELWIATGDPTRTPDHPFFDWLNAVVSARYSDTTPSYVASGWSFGAACGVFLRYSRPFEFDGTIESVDVRLGN
jgi:hypothetical protein